MDVWEAIEKRRTIRAFKEGVPPEMLRRLVRAGAMAPSGSHSQPWEFIILDDRKVIEEIAELKGKLEGSRGGPRRVAIEKGLYQNSSIVAVCHRKGGLASPAAWMAAQNMALAARAEGYGSVMTIFGGEYKATVEKLLKLPDTHELATVMALGVPEGDWPEQSAFGAPRPEFSWLHHNTFGEQD